MRCSTPFCSGGEAYIDWDEDEAGPGLWVNCPCGSSQECTPIAEADVERLVDEGLPDEREWNEERTGPKGF